MWAGPSLSAAHVRQHAARAMSRGPCRPPRPHYRYRTRLGQPAGRPTPHSARARLAPLVPGTARLVSAVRPERQKAILSVKPDSMAARRRTAAICRPASAPPRGAL